MKRMLFRPSKAARISKMAPPSRFYPVGEPGVAWGAAEREEWVSKRTQVLRSYADEVLAPVLALRGGSLWEVVRYGELPCDPTRYPLYAVRTRRWTLDGRPTVLVTGGVHGYETSGVQGALRFLTSGRAREYAEELGFNVAVAPCVSPWGYERVQRWNANAEDPNRGFTGPDSTRPECAALWGLVESLGGRDAFHCHLDLHETTDTDASEFRPAKAARDGLEYRPDPIPDGFYLVGDSEQPQEAWLRAIIAAVRSVTHIAPPDEKGEIIRERVQQEGVILIPSRKLFLCSSVTNASYAATTEVYPDSPNASDEICILAQVAAVTGAVDFIARNVELPRKRRRVEQLEEVLRKHGLEVPAAAAGGGA